MCQSEVPYGTNQTVFAGDGITPGIQRIQLGIETPSSTQ